MIQLESKLEHQKKEGKFFKAKIKHLEKDMVQVRMRYEKKIKQLEEQLVQRYQILAGNNEQLQHILNLHGEIHSTIE